MCRTATQALGGGGRGRQATGGDATQACAFIAGDMAAQCHYCTHYSSAIIVASFLVRMPPFTQAFCSLQVSVPDPLHTHTHTRTHMYTHKHTRACARTRTHPRAHAYTRTCTCTHTCTRAHTCAHTCPHTCPHVHTHAHTHIHTHARAHTELALAG